MSAILFCLFASTQTLASQLDRSTRPRSFQRPSTFRPGSEAQCDETLNFFLLTSGQK